MRQAVQALAYISVLGVGQALAASNGAVGPVPLAAEGVAPPSDAPVAVVSLEACDATDQYSTQLLSLRINGSNPRITLVVLRRKCGGVLVRTNDLNALRIKTDQQAQVNINGLNYVNILGFSGISAIVDEPRQVLRLEAEPQVFYATVVDFDPRSRGPTDRAAYGAYLNYGAGAQGNFEGGITAVTGTVGLGAFAPVGQLSSDWIVLGRQDRTQVLRLATTATRDFYGARTTLKAGDINPRLGFWGGAPALGGIQYGTNFANDPYRSVTSTFAMSAELRRVSTLFFTSTALQDSREIQEAARGTSVVVPYGPLEVINIPSPLSGAFRMSVFGDDGSRQDLERLFYFNPSLLREDAQDFSYEAGLIRQPGSDNDYSRLFASGLHRYGWTNWLTAELHGELGENGVALGFTGIVDVQPLGTLTATFAGTQHQEQSGAGVLGIVRWQKEYARFNYRLGYEAQNDSYLLPAVMAARNLFRDRVTADVSMAVFDRNVLGVQFQEGRQRTVSGQVLSRSMSANYSINLGAWGFLGVSGRRLLRPQSDYELGVFCSLPLFASTPLRSAPEYYQQFTDDDSVDSATISFAGNRSEGDINRGIASADYQWSRPEERYRVQLQRGVINDNRTGLFGGYGNQWFDAYAGVSGIHTELSQYSLGVSSALIWIDKQFFPTNAVNNSFALVRLGKNFEGARVNGFISDDKGNVLLHNLNSYVDNPLVIPSADLPSNAKIDSVPVVRPPFRAGVLVDYPVRLIREALIAVTVKNEQGAVVPLPMGAYATVQGSEEIFPAGSNGMIYLPELAETNTVQIHWRQLSCTIVVNLPQDTPPDAIAELGPYSCDGVSP